MLVVAIFRLQTTFCFHFWVVNGHVLSICASGSCWTFGTTGTIEGAYKLKTGKLQSFSEQQLVDCGWTNKISDFDNNGCGGGLEFLGVEYIMRVGGLQTEESYPYIMQDDYCHFDPQKAAVRVNHYVNVTEGDEQALQEAVALYGPISVGINVQSSFIFYSSGVYYDANCKSGFADLEHAVLVAGYGTENGQDYWLVKKYVLSDLITCVHVNACAISILFLSLFVMQFLEHTLGR
eukprot:TRINITY_DN1179_c0_g1_i3.p1 TRINITY_DN1179_c0_g1~~TRINITY_DN1179_c0_g1_i3.p1  ORF type:complete len:235 (-),score=46.04 TRINITY_DN1179_c0_g1_i3:145-849(-)